MSRNHLEYYQYAAPVVLTPLSLWLWLSTCQGEPGCVLMAWGLPILYAYLVPGIGTNVLKVWEFDVRWRLGRFRPHHGFVFGSATATLAWLCHTGAAQDLADVAQLGFVMAGVLGFWNILYDVKALETGILRVYTQPWADGKGPEAVALDYAPWFFGGFGAIYGIGIGLAELFVRSPGWGPWSMAGLFIATLAAGALLPVWGFRQQSMRRYGHSGCLPVTKGEGR